MMLELLTAPGGIDSNAYASLEEAEGYMESLAYKEAWEKASDEAKIAALVQAARWMGGLPWKGTKASQEQALAWPRRGASDQDGFEVPGDRIPRQAMEANAEFAFRLLEKDRAADAKKGISISGINIPDKERALIPPSVRDLLGHLLKSSGSIALQRG